MSELTPQQHRIIGVSAVLVMLALAGANYARHGTYTAASSVSVAPRVATDTVTTAPVITDTAPAPPRCEWLMDGLQQGRASDVEISPGLTRKYLEPGGGLSETLARAEYLDTFWPGRRVLLLYTQWDDGTRRGDSTTLIGCDGDRLVRIESASGPPTLEGNELRVEELESTSGDDGGRDRVRLTRFLSVAGGELRESEPSLRLSEHAPPVAQSGINTYGYEYASSTVDAIAPMAGRYRVLPETASSAIPEREILLQPDGLFLTRHSPDDAGPFPIGSFGWGEWFAVHRPGTMPEGTASIHLGFNNRPELVLGWEGERLTIGDTVYVRERIPGSRLWQHGGGDFQTLGDGRWYEKSPNGEFTFVEQSSSADTVELFDPSRNCHVRLTASDASVRCAGEARWNVHYNGGWEVMPVQ